MLKKNISAVFVRVIDRRLEELEVQRRRDLIVQRFEMFASSSSQGTVAEGAAKEIASQDNVQSPSSSQASAVSPKGPGLPDLVTHSKVKAEMLFCLRSHTGITLENQLGSGSYGIVYKVTLEGDQWPPSLTSLDLAVKVFNDIEVNKAGKGV